MLEEEKGMGWTDTKTHFRHHTKPAELWEELAENTHIPFSTTAASVLGNSKSEGDLWAGPAVEPLSARDRPRRGSEVFFTATNCSHIREETQHRVADLVGLRGTEDQADQSH